jgi:hypothetical protein
MNVTVVEDLDYRDRRLENRLNAVARHCKIGKVNWTKPVNIPSMWAPAVDISKYTPKIDPLQQVWNEPTNEELAAARAAISRMDSRRGENVDEWAVKLGQKMGRCND